MVQNQDSKTGLFVKTHGMWRSPEYRVWSWMLERCYYKRSKCYGNYGGRGITVCHRWRRSFEAFYEDMGQKPSKGHSIERVDNNRGYCKENCKWATVLEQANNKRTSRYLTFRGETKTMTQWSRATGIKKATIWYRLTVSGWDVERSLTTPTGSMKESWRRNCHA